MNRPITLFALAVMTSACSSDKNISYEALDYYQDGHFINANIAPYNTSVVSAMWSIYANGSDFPYPDNPLPIHTPSVEAMKAVNGVALTKLGHSTVLLSMGNELWLFDPIFSQYASPLSWAGPERFTPPALKASDLPNLKGVVISHNHFDHLDEQSIRDLIGKAEHFYVPLGIKPQMVEWGVSETNVTELGWWQSIQVDNVELIATPSQHFSGRSLTDANKTLWASWVLKTDEHRVFFSGDSGYFSGFEKIGEKYGPFDITLLENGAYNDIWRNFHMYPDQTVKAHQALKGKLLIPVHNSTFNLSNHAWFDPLEKVKQASEENNVTLVTPIFGDVVTIENASNHQKTWWRDYMPATLSKAD